MAEENNAPQVNEADESARRTLKLRPSNINPAGGTLADPIHGDTDTSNLDVLDDTQTRKTIKIKPLNPAGPQVNISAPGATPISGTQTRKTVVLKSPANNTATPLSGTQTRKAVVLSPNAAATPLTGTQTRKAVVLSPNAAATPLSGTQTRKAVVLSPNAAATPLSGTQTRKTVILKPVAKSTVSAPAEPATKTIAVMDDDDTMTKKAAVIEEAPAEKNVIADDDTMTKKATVIEEAPAPANADDDTMTKKATVIDETPADDDKTVKITRPQMQKPAPADDKKTVKLGTLNIPKANKPAAPAVSTASPETVVLDTSSTPAPAEIPAPASAPAKAAAPAPATAPAPKAAESPETVILMNKAVSAPEKADTAGEKTPKATSTPFDFAVVKEKPSVTYLVLTAIAIIFTLGAAALTAAHYLDLDHNIAIYQFLPGAPTVANGK